MGGGMKKDRKKLGTKDRLNAIHDLQPARVTSGMDERPIQRKPGTKDKMPEVRAPRKRTQV